ncbi:MAG: ATP-NAD kinase family protein [Chloroflexi bacterium]|nr:ATP-NAD kinase family protein [Chloroflexota bacterium]
MKRIGLVVNPIAGLGGRVGLKGSDGMELQRKALELGAVPHAVERAAQALQALLPLRAEFELLTYPFAMGAEAARQAGIDPCVLGSIQPGQTSAEDTVRAAREMAENEVRLLLFAGGDGTARDICNAIGMEIPALGIPAGVKIQSAVYATAPRYAGELAAAFLRGETELRQAEVMDLDEDAFRAGRVSACLYGYLKMPYLQRYVQGVKAPSLSRESAVLEAIAGDLADRMKPGWLYIFGPGSTTQAVATHIGFDKTLLGVDAVLDGKIVSADASEADLLRLLSVNRLAEIVVTPIGGQGCIFGRGNQPISPDVIRKVGRAHIRVISTPEKIQALNGHPLWADTGDRAVDEMLSGYLAVVTGYKESVMYKVMA